ncbi:MAG: hypothetical protein Tsb0027_05470 [Wenzhouxiangellaceae bacterium]
MFNRWGDLHAFEPMSIDRAISMSGTSMLNVVNAHGRSIAMATGIFAIASSKQLAGSMQQYTDAAANQRAVDADVLQIRPDLQFDAA